VLAAQRGELGAQGGRALRARGALQRRRVRALAQQPRLAREVLLAALRGSAQPVTGVRQIAP
jgi:hypothetical protein